MMELVLVLAMVLVTELVVEQRLSFHVGWWVLASNTPTPAYSPC
jgi:hypothetical protein